MKKIIIIMFILLLLCNIVYGFKDNFRSKDLRLITFNNKYDFLDDYKIDRSITSLRVDTNNKRPFRAKVFVTFEDRSRVNIYFKNPFRVYNLMCNNYGQCGYTIYWEDVKVKFRERDGRRWKTTTKYLNVTSQYNYKNNVFWFRDGYNVGTSYIAGMVR